MKSKLLALLALTALALPAAAQSVYISGPTGNGDLETGDLTPNFGGPGASAVLGSAAPSGAINDHSIGTGAGTVMCVDMTANNGSGQWKGITTNPGFPVSSDQDKVVEFAWVYIPAATTFGATARLNLNLQASTDGGLSYSNYNTSTPGVTTGAYQSLNLKTAARDTWIQTAKVGIDLPTGTTHFRLNHSIETLALVNGADADGGTDGTGPAVPADWNTEGYAGYIYIDDYYVSAASVVPTPPGTLICGVHQNGNFEAGLLAPWNPVGGAGDIDTVIVQEGTQSMSIDMGAGKNANRWRGMGLGAMSLPAVDGDIIGTSAWIYMPSTTTLGTPTEVAWFNAELRSDRNMAGNGNLTGQMRVNLTGLAKNDWVNVTALTTVTDGDQTVSAINTGGWNIETVDGADPTAVGYGGLIYFDDVQLKNLGPGPTSEGPGIMVGATDNNGDLEGDFPAPWGGIEPWTFSGAGSVNTDPAFVHSGTQSVCVDLTANNSNAQWKGVHTPLPTLDVVGLGYDTVDVTAWVYIPSIANGTTFGSSASLNLSLYDGVAYGANGGSINLTTANREEWIDIGAKGLDISGFTTNLAINNWNLQTLALVNGADADGGVDGTGPAVPADWIAEGYNGHIYVDDIRVEAYQSVVPVDLAINSIAYDDVTGVVTLNYDSTFIDGADVYYSSDLVNWTGPLFANDTGEEQIFTDDPGVAGPDVTELYYILVEPGTTPPPVGP